MAILINKNTKIIVQGITGSQGRFHTKQMLEYGTKIVAGVTPNKEGETVEGIPVYNTVKDALQHHHADYSLLFVPAAHAKKAVLEALDAGLNLVIITEGIPVHDTIHILHRAAAAKKIVIGPNSPGLCSVAESKIGIMPNTIFRAGNVGVVSRSGTLTYEVVNHLSRDGIGQSTCLGIGGDSVIGTNFNDALRMFEDDPATKVIVLIGEIGGNLEEKAAEYIKNCITKPVIAFIAGRTAPPGKTMGHAGAIIGDKGAGGAESKIKALEAAGAKVAALISEITGLVKAELV